MSLVLTPAKAAILLGLSDRAVRSLIQRNLLPARAVGQRLGGRQGPVRYEIALQDLQASGLPLDLTRLPLLATSHRTAAKESERMLPEEVQTLVQTLKEEQARVQALRGELEGVLAEAQRQLARLEAGAVPPPLSFPPPPHGYALTTARTATPRAGGALVEGPPSGLIPLWLPDCGTRIRHNAQRHLLVIDNSLVALSPTEYRLLLEILTQYAHWQAARRGGCFVVDQTVLQKIVGWASPRLVMRHLTHANAKLAPFGMRVQATEAGYTLILEQTVLPERAARPARRVR